MTEYKVTDKRQSLITDNLQGEMSSIRAAKATTTVKENANDDVRSQIRQANNNLVAMNKRMSSTQIVPTKDRKPLDSFRNADIPFEMEDRKDRALVWNWCRSFFATDSVIPLLIDIYARFPVLDIRLTGKDPHVVRFFEEMFENMNYQELLVDMGREYYQIGEVTSLGHWNESMGIWQREELLNPDNLMVHQGIFADEPSYQIGIPDSIKRLVETQEPRSEYERLVKDFPDIVELAKQQLRPYNTDEEFVGFDVSPTLISRTINKIQPWDLYGTPHMMRCFQYLILQESLMAAQGAVADRLYSPLILAKLGDPGLGDGNGPWIPTPEELDQFADSMNDALMADFRMLCYHFGVDIKNVFGRESVPRFDQDFQRIQDKILQVWGIGSSLISSSGGGTSYASSAINREFVTQNMLGWQYQIKRMMRDRMMVVAEAQEMFDYETSGNLRVPQYEEVLVRDYETGEERVIKRPKLLIPDIEFAAMNLRDESVERQFLQTLRGSGFPISESSVMTSIQLEWEDELEKAQEESIKKAVAEAESQVKMVRIFKEAGLPVPANLKSVEEHLDSGGKKGEMAEEPAFTDEDKVHTPNVAPDEEDLGVEVGADNVTELPKNRLVQRPLQERQRPEESDEQRTNAPRAARVANADAMEQLRKIKRTGKRRVPVPTGGTKERDMMSLESGPSTVHKSAVLEPDQVADAIRERKWVASIKKKPSKP